MSFKNERIVETKACQKCQASFDITDKDLEFYDQVSPVFEDRKYGIPTPTLCPDCRQQKRLSFRNERALYKRKCDLTEKEIISIYSPDKPHTVYENEAWWSDGWNALDYGRNFDFDQSFTQQFRELSHKVPQLGRYVLLSTQSDYTNGACRIKKCYLCFNIDAAEECCYCYTCNDLEKSFDCSFVKQSQLCYYSCNLLNCFQVFASDHSSDCRTSSFLSACQNCEDCFMCVNQVWKKYCLYNEQYTQEEYEQKKSDLLSTKTMDQLQQDLEVFKWQFPKKSSYTVNIEDTTGDYITDMRGCKNAFDGNNLEDCKYCWYVYDAKDCMDYDIFGSHSELMYECIMAWDHAHKNAFSFGIWDGSRDLYYCSLMSASKNCFGCIWLKNQQYCIFNKQYTQPEYEKLVPKIIEKMKQNWEWWEFFDGSIAPCWYNESVAQDYYPLRDDNSPEKWFYWSDYESPKPDVTKIIPADKLPENISDIPDDILNWAIECEETGRLFRIIAQELEFYRKYDLAIPHKHPDQRHLARMKLRNPRKLYQRDCDSCWITMSTTYSPEREVVVYCESCYNKTIY